MKVLIVVTHLLGVGHLARAAALGRALARAGHEVVLASGGRVAPNVSMTGIRLIQLPSLHVQGTDFNTLYAETGALVDASVFAARSASLAETLRDFRPDALVIELFPFGRRQLVDEHLKLLAFRHGFHPEGTPNEAELYVRDDVKLFVACSIRDVLAPPSKPGKISFAEETLARHFDQVLVHGDARVLPLGASWPVSPGLAKVLRYTGYVRDHEAQPKREVVPEGEGEVVVSGGGSSASLPLMRAALDAARLVPARRWRLLVGHGVPEAEFVPLREAAPDNARVERARKDFAELLSHCACSVSQAGYNTMLDLAAAGCPAVVVPFDAGKEVEQVIRAEKFAAMGLVEVVREAELSGAMLNAAVARAVAGGAGPHPPAGTYSRRREKEDEAEAGRFGGRAAAERSGWGALDLAGAATSVRLIEAGVAERRALVAAWAEVADGLDQLAAQGRVLDFWWRDDDAVSVTPALERLLELRRALDVPLALAVIPERAGSDLAERLRDEPAISVLVHGISHQNNAAAPAKKQELIAGGDATLAALRQGRERLETLFGAQALPVLVPPWNRIAPDLVARLGEAGFAGVSTFGAAGNADEAWSSSPAFRWVNTHLDPIDWRGGGGLVRASAHIATLASLIRKRVQQVEPELAPVGLLTHHLVHDPWIWAHVEDVVRRLKAHRSVRFQTAERVFGLT